MIPEWAKDLSLAAIIVVGIVIVAREYINKVAAKRGPAPCSHVINEPLKELVAEFRKEQEHRRKSMEKQQEAFNGIVLTLTNLCSTTTQTLERVKDIESSLKK